LRAARVGLDLDVEDIALVTRVRGSYLTALEDFNLDALPARPFAVGYVRAYALALGLDPDAVVARFRQEAPKVDGKLKPPGGLMVRPGQWAWTIRPAVAVALALLGWNLFRHFGEAPAKAPVAIAKAPAPGIPSLEPTRLGPPLPPPIEAGGPPVYHTPGLEPDTVDEAANATTAIGAPLTSGGVIYGASGPSTGPASGTLFKAAKPTSFIVRSGANVVFARVLNAGEAWRAPPETGLTLDVASPSAIDIYIGGVKRGPLLSEETALSRLPLATSSTR